PPVRVRTPLGASDEVVRTRTGTPVASDGAASTRTDGPAAPDKAVRARTNALAASDGAVRTRPGRPGDVRRGCPCAHERLRATAARRWHGSGRLRRPRTEALGGSLARGQFARGRPCARAVRW